MAIANINFFEQVGRGYDSDVPVFDGTCSQDRVDIGTVPTSFSSTPAVTISADTKFVQIVSDSKIKVYCGSSAASDAVKQARAFVMTAGTIALATNPTQVLHIWTA